MVYREYEIFDLLKDTPGVQREYWGQCFKMNEPDEKILRNIPPTRITVVVEMVPSTYRFEQGRLYPKLVAYTSESYGKAKPKKIVLTAQNSHGVVALYDMYDECVAAYNRDIDRAIKDTDSAIEGLQSRKSELISFQIK